MTAVFLEDLPHAVDVTLQRFRHQGWLERILERAASLVHRLLWRALSGDSARGYQPGTEYASVRRIVLTFRRKRALTPGDFAGLALPERKRPNIRRKEKVHVAGMW